MSTAHVSPTAAFVALIRQHSGIPYAAEIARLCKAQGTVYSFFRDAIAKRIAAEPHRARFWGDIDIHSQLIDPMVSGFDAWAQLRLASLTEAAHQLNNATGLELGAGLSSRGLIVSKDPNLLYVETDLPNMIQQKSAISCSILGQRRENLWFAPLDILEDEILERVLLLGAPRRPITVITEGVLVYFSPGKYLQVAKNVRRLLDYFGGAWITSDVILKQWFLRPEELGDLARLRMELLLAGTGTDMRENAFDSYDQAEALFAAAGFTIEHAQQLDIVPELVRSMSDADIARLGHEVVWTMRPR